MTKYVDGLLIDWGTKLFNRKKIAGGSNRKGRSGFPIPSKTSVKGSKINAMNVRNKLSSISKRTPEVMVKITGTAKKGTKAVTVKNGRNQVMAQLKYISRDGQLEVEDQEGLSIKGKDKLSELHDEWVYGGHSIPEESNKREAFSVVLSMPEGTDSLSVKRAARDFAAKEFSNHQYVMVQHTFETDPEPNPSLNPHVHLVIKATSLDGTRLNPRKADLQRWREGFAEALCDHGVEAAATNRMQRLKRERGDRQSTYHIKKKGKSLNEIGKTKADASRVERAKEAETEVFKCYQGVLKTLATSEDVNDRKLAVEAIHYIDEQTRSGRQRITQQEWNKDLTGPER